MVVREVRYQQHVVPREWLLMKLNATRRAYAGFTPPSVPAGLCGPECAG